MDAEPEKLAQAPRAAWRITLTWRRRPPPPPQADDLCIAHFEVVQVGRYTAAVLAVTSAGGVRTRVARVGEGFTRGDAQALAALLNRSLTFVVAEDVTPQPDGGTFCSSRRKAAPRGAGGGSAGAHRAAGVF